MVALQVVPILLRLLLQSRSAIAAENLALRHQVALLQRSVKRPRLHRRDRVFRVRLSHLWRGWRSSLIVVQPETVERGCERLSPTAKDGQFVGFRTGTPLSTAGGWIRVVD
jgi:hypothetical protein